MLRCAGSVSGAICVTALLWAGAASAYSGLETPKEAAQVEQAIRDWAVSWDRSDTAAYLAHYARDFTPPSGLSYAQWAQQRRARLKASAPRQVFVRDLRVEVEANTAQVRFTQHYLDMDLISTASKRMTLVRQNGEWKIRAEQIESERALRR